jgi:hypothetical protein
VWWDCGGPGVLSLVILEEQKGMKFKHKILQACLPRCLVLVVYIAAGCASIVDGGPQTLAIKSNPSEAKLVVYDMRKGEAILNATTPYTATLNRGSGYFKPAKYKVVVDKQGYESKEYMIEGNVNGWYLGNLLFGGLIGFLVVDPLTGAMYKLEPKDINVELTQKLAISHPNQGLVLLLKDKLYGFPDMLDKLQPLAGLEAAE